ncbi:MAG: hypothetical protein K5637_07020 [Lachnospiraceae bacterium]|nr:hypothetical protein [Lachnospiraceae bacterium]
MTKRINLIISSAIVCSLCFLSSGCSAPATNNNETESVESDSALLTDTSSDSSEPKDIAETNGEAEAHVPIYESAQIVDVMDGTGTEKIGTISLVKANQSDCTDAALADWFFNYVLNNTDCDYHLIIYNDVANKGVFANANLIVKDAALNKEKDGTYTLGDDDSGSTYYTVNESEKTISAQKVIADEDVVNNVKAQVDKVIPESYKNSPQYAILVGGEAGKLNCKITIVNEDFASIDCQNIAVELAAKVKELDLGIGCFCIAFQSDDYTLHAFSGLNDLTVQDPNEINTQTDIEFETNPAIETELFPETEMPEKEKEIESLSVITKVYSKYLESFISSKDHHYAITDFVIDYISIESPEYTSRVLASIPEISFTDNAIVAYVRFYVKPENINQTEWYIPNGRFYGSWVKTSRCLIADIVDGEYQMVMQATGW